MPTPKAVLFRLLNLYPLDDLRENWQLKAKTKSDLITEILKVAEEQQIVTFCQSKHEVSKQHLFIFENESNNLEAFPTPLLSTHAPSASNLANDEIHEFYLLPVTYTVVAGPPYRDVELRFLWPVAVLANKRYTIMALTILEKNIDAYLAKGERAYSVDRNLDEETILRYLTGNMPEAVTLSRADLNKGVKALWDKDKIDAPMGRWQEAKLVASATMIGKYLLKRDAPEKYKEAIKGPLLKMLFVGVDSEADFQTQFSTSASDGEIMFNRFSKPNEVSNVVRAILTAN